MLVTIIILTYNKFDYLFECLDSAIMQNYEEIELIISDDGSNSFPKNEIQNYLEKHKMQNLKNYIIRETSVNEGTVKNLNRALDNVNGEYIIPIAADDVFYDEYVVSKFIENAQKAGLKDLVFTSQVEKLDCSLKNHIGYALNEKQKKFLSDKNRLFYELSKECFIASGGTMYKKDFFVKYGKFDEKYKLIEDWPTFLKLARLKEAIVFCDFVSVRHRDGGVSQISEKSKLNKDYHQDLIRIMELEILNYVKLMNNNKREIIKICKDKKTIYTIRFDLKNYTFIEKIKFIFSNICFVGLISRKIIRRIK